MARMNTSPCKGDVVRAPQPSDGVGDALRGIYDDVPGLPADWRALLTRLDRYHYTR